MTPPASAGEVSVTITPDLSQLWAQLAAAADLIERLGGAMLEAGTHLETQGRAMREAAERAGFDVAAAEREAAAVRPPPVAGAGS